MTAHVLKPCPETFHCHVAAVAGPAVTECPKGLLLCGGGVGVYWAA